MIPAQQRSLRRPVTEVVTRFEHMLTTAPPQFDAEQPELMRHGRAVVRLLQERLDTSAGEARPDATWATTRRLVDQATILLASAIRQDRPGVLTRGTYGRCLDALTRIASTPAPVHSPETLLASARAIALAAAAAQTAVAPPPASWAYCC